VIAKSYILNNLYSLDSRYQNANSAKEALFCSKLAILELSGWVEESMDDIVLRCAMRRLKESSNRQYCRSQIVNRTYGFDYQNNFRFMLIRLLGLISVENLERKVNQTKYSRMTAALTSLKAIRDSEAHTHLKGTTRTLNAPSATIAQFTPVYEGLIEFDRVLRNP
jgi:hypothetical protein